ncbi:MAG: 2-amino-4-hydroxy-6-hydroxymethyldihydropteridine diphosphokinase [Novosphingobium sp.]|uniref:2-amino-4-hydroxy-6- hydroxymethyldihydropteridine diphosphokinase n=1 Tax=Novosphingobium sp. TaxID=1874826 RepID=UPI003C7B76AA
MSQRYLIALGSNVRHHRFGPPEQVLNAALAELTRRGITVKAAGPVLRSAPIGPSLRRYANSAAVVKWHGSPEDLLHELKAVERSFGRRTGGQRWTSRVLDLDIVLWSGRAWSSADLTVPHLLFRQRDFVLKPAAALAPDWRDPVTGLTVRQLAARLAKPVRI